MQIISDEIYALSIFPGHEMLSIATYSGDSKDIYIIGGLSKDFGVSGFRVGFCLSKNQELIKAMGGLGYFQLASNMTQYVMTQILNDEEWLDNYVKTNRQRIYEKYLELKEALDVN